MPTGPPASRHALTAEGVPKPTESPAGGSQRPRPLYCPMGAPAPRNSGPQATLQAFRCHRGRLGVLARAVSSWVSAPAGPLRAWPPVARQAAGVGLPAAKRERVLGSAGCVVALAMATDCECAHVRANSAKQARADRPVSSPALRVWRGSCPPAVAQSVPGAALPSGSCRAGQRSGPDTVTGHGPRRPEQSGHLCLALPSQGLRPLVVARGRYAQACVVCPPWPSLSCPAVASPSPLLAPPPRAPRPGLTAPTTSRKPPTEATSDRVRRGSPG